MTLEERGEPESSEEISGQKEYITKNMKVILYFILIVFAWTSIGTLQDTIRSFFLKNVYDSVNTYCIFVFTFVVAVLFYFNGFTLEGCGLV